MRRQWLLASLALLCATAGRAEPITLCDLAGNPSAYDKRVVEITGFVSHGFEDFTLFDPLCTSEEARVWLEYGGTFASGTIYCCGPGDERSRPEPLVVEGIQIPIILDSKLKQFDKLIQGNPDSVVHATIRGRFFSGEKQELPGGTSWVGYGHFGMSSLLAIEQVLQVEPHDLRDVDYRAAPDQPETNGVGCYSREIGDSSSAEAIEQQRRADSGEDAYRFNDPVRVASNALFELLSTKPVRLKQKRKSAGRVVYVAMLTNSPKKYMVVVSRPYWLSFFAKDRRRVAWTVIAAFESGCPEK